MCTQVVIEEISRRSKDGVKRSTSSFPTQEAAVETAKALIESGLLELWQRGMSAQTLLNHWSALGEDVYVMPENGERCFSGKDYARDFAGELTARGRL
jgi:hypothetical protein